MEEPGVPGEENGSSFEVAVDNGNGLQELLPPDPDVPMPVAKPKFSNVLPFHGNASTMNLNPLVLNNIQSSHYFKVELYARKTYHEVIDEMYHHVKHLEPWEKGSRKTAGQTGMCGGVRGVGAGGIVSTAFCILYKLYTLKLTRKQLNGLIHYEGAPHVRALGFVYIRYTQPPADLWTWYEPFLDDEEEVEVRAGGGHPMTVGQIVRGMLTKLDWFSTLFPRIPVPIQKDILAKLKEYDDARRAERKQVADVEREEKDREKKRSAPRDDLRRHGSREKSHRSDEERRRSRSHDRGRGKSRSRDRDMRDHSRKNRDRSTDRHKIRDRKHRDDNRHRRRSRSASRDRGREKRPKEDDHHRRDKGRRRSRSRSRDRRHR